MSLALTRDVNFNTQSSDNSAEEIRESNDGKVHSTHVIRSVFKYSSLVPCIHKHCAPKLYELHRIYTNVVINWFSTVLFLSPVSYELFFSFCLLHVISFCKTFIR